MFAARSHDEHVAERNLLLRHFGWPRARQEVSDGCVNMADFVLIPPGYLFRGLAIAQQERPDDSTMVCEKAADQFNDRGYPPRQIYLICGRSECIDALDRLLNVTIVDRPQKSVFRTESLIDRTHGNARFTGNLRNCDLIKMRVRKQSVSRCVDTQQGLPTSFLNRGT